MTLQELETAYEVAEVISTSNVTGLGRVACYAMLQHDTKSKSINLLLHIYPMMGGSTIDNSPEIRPYYEKLLTVSNSTRVDINGDVVTEEVEGGTYFGEYDFYIMAIKSGADVYELISIAIAKADEKDRFDEN